jgi:AcrR family transcriptional regulator
MFFRLGIRSVSIDDICRELGMSKKTFYVYFASKDELVSQLLHANVEHIAAKMETLQKQHDFRQLVAKLLKHQEAEKGDVRRVPQLSMISRSTTPDSLQTFRQSASRPKRPISSAIWSKVSRRGLYVPIWMWS